MTNEENHSVPPTDDQIVQAFRDYVAERSSENVQYAQAVSDIAYSDGSVTFTLDPLKDGVQLWALTDEFTPDLARVFGAPINETSDHASWLRQRVEQIVVIDADGRGLYSATYR